MPKQAAIAVENTPHPEAKAPGDAAHLSKFKWQPGQSGNPKGRTPGTRVRFGDRFYDDLADIWEREGKNVLEALARDQPEVLFAGVVKLQPKLIAITDEREPLNDQQRALNLLAALRALHQGGALVPILERLGVVGGADNADSGIAEAGPVIDVPPVSEAV